MEISLKGSTEKESSHFLGLRGRHQYSHQRFNLIRASCVGSTAAGVKGEEDQMARLSAQREQLKKEGRDARSSLMKREKTTKPELILAEHLDGLVGAAFVTLQNDENVRVNQESLSPTSEARIEANRQKL